MVAVEGGNVLHHLKREGIVREGEIWVGEMSGSLAVAGKSFTFFPQFLNTARFTLKRALLGN